MLLRAKRDTRFHGRRFSCGETVTLNYPADIEALATGNFDKVVAQTEVIDLRPMRDPRVDAALKNDAYREMVSVASALGVYRVGMQKPELRRALESL